MALSTRVLTYQGAVASVKGEILRVKRFKGIKLFFHLSQKEKKREEIKERRKIISLCGDQMQTGVLSSWQLDFSELTLGCPKLPRSRM